MISPWNAKRARTQAVGRIRAVSTGVKTMIGAVLVLGCGADPNAGDGDTSESSSSTESSSGESSSESDDSSTSGEPLPECPPGDGAMMQLDIEPELLDPNRETAEGDEEATCTIDSIGGDAVDGWRLVMTCDIEGGAMAQPRTIEIVTPSSPFAAFALDQAVGFRQHQWYGFQVGGGMRLALAQGGATMVLAYVEDIGGGTTQNCVSPTDSAIVRANEWLTDLGARVEPAECEDLGALRLARMAGGDEYHVYGGQHLDVGDGMQALVGQARCDVEFGGEFWTLELVLWRG